MKNISKKLNKATYLFLLIVLCFFFSGNGQIILLEGVITNPDEVENIHVLNTTSRYNAITNQEGKFRIEVQRNDTLVFSGIKYFPKKVIITAEMYRKKHLSVALVILLNQLDEVVLGNRLSGDLMKDVERINTQKDFNFDDVGIPGFKGKPEEKIPVLLGQAITPVSVNLEAMYKYITGYYKNLKMVRKWVSQDMAAAEILTYYGTSFFMEAYGVPENRTYDFVLFCLETTQIEKYFKIKNFNGVLTVFKDKSPAYVSQLPLLEKE
ncbi:MAG: hypothetical protein ACI849_000191 [Patiriisocius sp.]